MRVLQESPRKQSGSTHGHDGVFLQLKNPMKASWGLPAELLLTIHTLFIIFYLIQNGNFSFILNLRKQNMYNHTDEQSVAI